PAREGPVPGAARGWIRLPWRRARGRAGWSCRHLRHRSFGGRLRAQHARSGASGRADAEMVGFLGRALENVRGATGSFGHQALDGEQLIAFAGLLEELPPSSEEPADEPLETVSGAEAAEGAVERDQLPAVRVARV